MKKPLTVFALALFSALLSHSANAVEWKLISETEDKDKITSWYVDMTSIVREDDYLRAFLRTSWSAPQFGPDRTPYQSSTYTNYIDCDSRKIAYTGNAYYRDTEPEGNPVHQEPEHPVSRLKFQSVKPGSAGEARLRFICQFRSKNFLTRRTSPSRAG